MEEKVLEKKQEVLQLLHYLDENNMWNMAKHLINYIEKVPELEMVFLEYISDIVKEAVQESKDRLEKETLEKISANVEKMRTEEEDSLKNDDTEADKLLHDINDI